MHRTEVVWPLLRVWTMARPDSATAWWLTGWAHQVDGDASVAAAALRTALALDPEHEVAARMLAELG